MALRTVQGRIIPLSILALSILATQTTAYNQSLADCKLVAAQFRNTCDHGDYDTPAPNVTNMTSNTEYCDDGSFRCFVAATMNAEGACEWERKLCVTCKEVNGTVKIRLQTNNLPDHCIENKLAKEVILDYEVNFNPQETHGEWIRDCDSELALYEEVCPIHKDYDTDTLGIIEYGGTESEHAMGFAINGIAFQFFNSIQQDPVAPITVDNEQPLDICLGHNQLNSDSGMYHYHAVSPCINQTFLDNKEMSDCTSNSECAEDVVSWMLSGFEGMKNQTVIGLSKFGHVVYGPYDNTETLWQPQDVDACNGAWSDEEDEYFYVTSRWHPYGPGCNGPTHFPDEEGVYPNCSANGIDQYITNNIIIEPSIEPTGNPTVNPTPNVHVDPTRVPSEEPTTYPTIYPTIESPTDPKITPTREPASDPVDRTIDPTTESTNVHTNAPSVAPTTIPSQTPTRTSPMPSTAILTHVPTTVRSEVPTTAPSQTPTNTLSVSSTAILTLHPTFSPTVNPSDAPTFVPISPLIFEPSLDPTRDPTIDPTFDRTENPTNGPTKEPTTQPTFIPNSTPTSSPTPSLCYDAIYQSSMSCDGDECDSLWGGESMASSDCQYLLVMENSGDLVLYQVNDSRRRLLDDFVIGWSSNTSVSYGIPRMTLFSNGNTSGFVIYEMESRNDADPISLWSRIVPSESIDGNVTLSLSDDGALQLSDESGSLWSESGSFSIPDDDVKTSTSIITYILVTLFILVCILTVIIGPYYFSKKQIEKKSTSSFPGSTPHHTVVLSDTFDGEFGHPSFRQIASTSFASQVSACYELDRQATLKTLNSRMSTLEQMFNDGLQTVQRDKTPESEATPSNEDICTLQLNSPPAVETNIVAIEEDFD